MTEPFPYARPTNRFLASKGNEYFCEIDDEYIVDRFNLTGLNAEVSGYSGALELITDSARGSTFSLARPHDETRSLMLFPFIQLTADEDLNDEQRDQLETAARHLYGLIHARFIITSRGLAKMVRFPLFPSSLLNPTNSHPPLPRSQIEKYKKGDFGRCPRVLCYGQPLLPLGLSDIAYQKAVKLHCPRCEDLYSPKSSRHGAIDGAYFGSTFAHMLFMVYPGMIPPKNVPAAGASAGQGGLVSAAAGKVERVRPKIFGFKVHEQARLQRWQEGVRDKCAPFSFLRFPFFGHLGTYTDSQLTFSRRQIQRLEEYERQGALD